LKGEKVMQESILVGQGKQILSLPRDQWESHLARVPDHAIDRLRFMSDAHHLVRNFVVRRLPVLGHPVPPSDIAANLDLSPRQVNQILDELEQHLFFLVRDEQGAVSWAFPVTVDPTHHRLTFDSGDRLYAA
jgi:hypothetical protein